jgi:hypothetical protein
LSNSAINITAGTGTPVDTWLVGTDHQQIVVARGYPAATATLSNVADAATSTTLLAANTSRLGAIIYNDSTSKVWVKFGSAASSTSFTFEIPNDDWIAIPGEMGVVYTGIITGIWETDAGGSARVTELTA